MKKLKNKKGNKKKYNLILKIISILLIISAVITSGFLIYFEILPILYLCLFIIIIGLIVFGLFMLLNNKRLKKWIRTTLSIPSVIMIIIFTLVCFYSVGTIGFLSSIFDVGIRNDSYSVYVLESREYEDIKELDNRIIGVSERKEDSTEKAIDKVSNKIDFNMAEYETSSDSVEALKNSEVDAIIALDSNIDILKEDNNEYDDLKAIYTFTVSTKVETLDSNVDVSKENFVFYISGIDTNGKVAAKARSDVNILVAVNPKENKILMVNTPRDYYVKLHNKKAMDKLTHAGVYGIEESFQTLEDLYDIKVNYYARVNFTTFINIVEELDGITVDVPVSFCEQTSSRTSSKQICLKKGKQILNGEEALALSRTRHTIAGGDRGRIENQMLVLESIIDKALSPKIIVKYNSLLSSVSDSVVTNIEQKSITKLIKKQIKNNNAWTIETYSVDGTDGSNVTYSTGNSKAYIMNPKEETVLEAKKKLDEILETNKYSEETTKNINEESE